MFGRLFKKTDFKQLMTDGAVIIDVRNPGEFKGGAAPGSENIPLTGVSRCGQNDHRGNAKGH